MTLEHVKGHSGDEGNDGADRLANLGAQKPEVPEPDWAAREKAMRNTTFKVQQPVDPPPVAGVTDSISMHGQRRAPDVNGASLVIVDAEQVMNELEVGFSLSVTSRPRYQTTFTGICGMPLRRR